ncbi:hypothetical protein TRIUR3_29325 [Triticum urartu]|uniref:Uncharacterized protein n=1 Tax=Triticum urartu TaxID=4572 RepID=M8ACC9_TRIUA|nr:hypothetical protein TRIUR3_29325 [Triticum urartu]
MAPRLSPCKRTSAVTIPRQHTYLTICFVSCLEYIKIVGTTLSESAGSNPVSVSLQNYQLYRHLEDPGWRLAMSCEKQPVMMDLGPGAPYNLQVANCCQGGVLSSVMQNSKAATSTFMMTVGNFAPSSDGSPQMPFNFSIGVPGYTCSNATVVPPSRPRSTSSGTSRP